MSEAGPGRGSGFPPGFPPERMALYLAGNEGAPPREQLVRALPHVDGIGGAAVRRALDVGCGPGREAVLLARQGFEVVAFDPYPEMLERTRMAIAREPDGDALLGRVSLACATLEEFAATLEADSFDIVHAGFVLPFVLPERFDDCFERLVASLRPRGVLCGQFFGREDEFIRAADAGTMTCHDRRGLERLFEGFELIEFEEVNRLGRIGKGREKWWHVFHVTARRP